MEYKYIGKKGTTLECKDHAEVYTIAFCKFESRSVIKECIIKALDIFLKEDPNFSVCKDDDIFLSVNNKDITVKEMREIVESIMYACTINTDEFSYDTEEEWQEAMNKYETGLLNLATYLDYFWV